MIEVSDNWMRAMDAIAELLKNQALEDVGGDVQVQTTPFTPNNIRPGCYVSPEQRHRRESLCTNEREAYGYGCRITVVRGWKHSEPERSTVWIETASRLFHKKRFWEPRCNDKLLPAIVEEPVNSVAKDEELENKPLDAVSVIVRAWVQEERA